MLPIYHLDFIQFPCEHAISIDEIVERGFIKVGIFLTENVADSVATKLD